MIVDTDVLVVDSINDKVGVGTASPDFLFEVASTLPTIALNETDKSQIWRHFISNTVYYFRPLIDSIYRIDDKNSVNVFTADTVNNRIGVGTITPSVELDVVGTIASDRIEIDGDNVVNRVSYPLS